MAGNSEDKNPVSNRVAGTAVETGGAATGVVAAGIAATLADPTTVPAVSGTKVGRLRVTADESLKAACRVASIETRASAVSGAFFYCFDD